MKQTSKIRGTRFSTKAKHTARRRVRNSRPLHRSIALHPINLLFLLCVGVLLSGSTLSATAASYTVNGKILAPIPTDPAIITHPTSEQQLSPQVQVISGTCPSNTYVEVADNNTLAGIAVCDQDGTFQVKTSLVSGANVLTAQDYNVTNNPGPSSPSVTVYYFPPALSHSLNSKSEPAYVAPKVLKLLQLDNGIPFEPTDGLQLVSYEPTFTGIAPPDSLILITIHTNPYYCHTYANGQGYWSCRFNQIIPPGLHTVAVTAQTPSDQMISLPSFHTQVTAAPPKSQLQSTRFSVSTNYAYQVYELNKPVSLNLHVNGGIPPYAFTVTWGNGNISTYVRQTNADFNITHTYTHLQASFGSMPVKIAAVDTKGDFSSLQVDVALRNPEYVASSLNKPYSGQSILSKIRPWLTVLWPGYLIILLMVSSFWLGERQEMIALLNGKKISKHAKRRQSHSHS